MKKLRLLPLLAFLTGCAHLHLPWPSSNEANVDDLRHQHRYISALAVLDAHSSKTPDYAARRGAILQEAQDYQSELLQNIDELSRQKQFAQAQALLDQATPELPDSDELRTYTEQFQGNRDRYVQRTLDQLYQLRGSQLAREAPLYQALQNSASDPELRALAARHQDDAEFFAQRLAAAGAQALAQGDNAKAMQYLGTANQLAPSPQTAQQLGRAEQAVSASKEKFQAARSAEREQKYRELNANIQQALLERDYVTARQQLEQAKALSIHSEDTDTYQRQLDAAVNSFVKQQVEEGNRRYANGHIEEALHIWRQADSLAPSQELKERIEKAQRFMERYQQLQKKSSMNAAKEASKMEASK